MTSYKKNSNGRLSFWKIIFYIILVCIPVIGWIILFFWIKGDVKAHNHMIDEMERDTALTKEK
ncbi:MAG: hypothetical protein LBV37_02300 [Mycoplasmataceae bacterium]|jgi:hypothetical protein|nr:hypothetical protein [Mycoplasmataceae bacterium]